jgi:hypothetical protein
LARIPASLYTLPEVNRRAMYYSWE